MTEHFIPLRKADVVALCTSDQRLDSAQRAGLVEVCALLASTFHFEFHRHVEELKDLYAPMDPDLDTRPLTATTPAQLVDHQQRLGAALQVLLERANYRRLDEADLNRALSEESVFRVRLHCQLDDFAELVLYARGLKTGTHGLRTWFGLRRTEIAVDYYERVVIYARFQPSDHFPAKRRAALPFIPGSTILKLFRNIPRADLEMLFPNVEVRMKTADQLMLGVPAVAGGIVVLSTKLAATLLLISGLVLFWIGMRPEQPAFNHQHLVGLGLGVSALATFLWRQFNAFKNRKMKFMKALSDSLYFKNLDNNAGVFHRVVDDAEEEECKETILAYTFLLAERTPLIADALDQRIEAWFRDTHGITVDFEVADALAKLVRLGLAHEAGGAYTAVPVVEAKVELDRRWDGYFAFHQAKA